MKYIRPPKGEFSEKTLQLTNQLGYTTVMWSFAYEEKSCYYMEILKQILIF